MTTSASVTARHNDNGRQTDVTIAGCGPGGHSAYVRFDAEDGRTVRRDVEWDGDITVVTVDSLFSEGLAVVDNGEERRFPVAGFTPTSRGGRS